jgi:hypothetical protein
MSFDEIMTELPKLMDPELQASRAKSRVLAGLDEGFG